MPLAILAPPNGAASSKLVVIELDHGADEEDGVPAAVAALHELPVPPAEPAVLPPVKDDAVAVNGKRDEAGSIFRCALVVDSR